jgi:hypothetical protein
VLFEVKPKVALSDGRNTRTRTFTKMQQKSASDPSQATNHDSTVPYDSAELFDSVISKDLVRIRAAVTKLATTRYLQGAGKTSCSKIDRLTDFMASESAHSILHALRQAQSTGLHAHALIAQKLRDTIGEEIVREGLARLRCDWHQVTSKQFESHGATLLSARLTNESPDDSIKCIQWIKRFLLARAAMDVSLLIDEAGNFTVVDLDMKPIEKINKYANEALLHLEAR